MTDHATKPDPELPAAIVDVMETAGFAPRLATLMSIVEDFARAKAEAKAATARIAELEQPAEGPSPLKMLLPDLSWYEPARRAAEAGRLEATKAGERWFSTQAAVARWMPTCRRWRLRKFSKPSS